MDRRILDELTCQTELRNLHVDEKAAASRKVSHSPKMDTITSDVPVKTSITAIASEIPQGGQELACEVG